MSLGHAQTLLDARRGPKGPSRGLDATPDNPEALGGVSYENLAIDLATLALGLNLPHHRRARVLKPIQEAIHILIGGKR